MRDDVFIRYIGLPTTVNAVTLPDEDGNYNVYINARLLKEEQELALRHELYHINNGHIYNYTPVADCEDEAKAHVKRYRR